MRIFTAAVLVCQVLLAFNGRAQGNNQRYAADNYRPLTPGAYSLIKYLDNPTDLYHGMPQISVPIYTLKVGEKAFSLALAYHAGGIRVTEEASWIGLGWDLSLPTVVQTINDEDDLTPMLGSYTVPRLRPDWPLPNSGYTIALPQRYKSIFGGVSNGTYYDSSTPGQGWTNPYPASGNKPIPETKHYYKSCLNYYTPVNKDFNTKQSDLFTYRVDSEPDVFTVDLFGTTLNFSKNFETGAIVLLDNTIYRISQTASGWSIQDGDGYVYQFASKNVHTVTVSDINGYGTSISDKEPSMVIWYLSSIVSPQGQQATFIYGQPYPARTSVDFKQKYQRAIRQNTSQTESYLGEAYQTVPYTNAGLYPNYVYPTKSLTYETKNYIQTIISDNAVIDFYASPRQDIANAQQLDSLHVSDPARTTLLKYLRLTHDYFTANANSTTANTFPTTDGSGVETQRNDLRLRLAAIQELGTGTYRFTYAAEPLPVRNSFAQDFWGYYNGAFSNTSLVPSSFRLNYRPTLIPDNGNNNGAQLRYAQAGILTRMTLPTGGSKSYEYELNTYSSVDITNNFSSSVHLPDYDSLDNRIIKGNGLRVKRITSSPHAGETPLITDYAYFNGRTMLPTAYHREITYTVVTLPGSGYNTNIPPYIDSYIIYEIKSNFQYSPALLGSGTGVGYSRVEERQSKAGTVPAQSEGFTTYYYANAPDVDRANDPGFYADEAGGLNAATQISLPAYQNPTTKPNGLVDSVHYVDAAGQLRRKSLHTYRTFLSPLDYGVKFFSGGIYYETYMLSAQYGSGQWAKNYLGFYPIFGKLSAPLSETNVDYAPDGTAFTRKLSYSLDSQNRIIRKQEENYARTPDGRPVSFEPGATYTYTYPGTRAGNVDLALLAQNRLNNPVVLNEVHAVDNSVNPGISGQAYTYEKFYSAHSAGAALDSVVETGTTPTEAVTRHRVTRYGAYDALNRPQQQAVTPDVPTTYLWYGNVPLELAAVKNATPGTILYTSFEPGEPNRWGVPIPLVGGGVTGNMCQPLHNGLSSPRLPAGIYTISYWWKGTVAPPAAYGPYTLSGRQTASRQDGWKQYQGVLTLSNTSSVALSFAASSDGLLDEFRLYPVGAQMLSYTYGPWQNITSQTDATGRLILYEYDAAGRLLRTRDEQGRILSQQQYQFANQ